jgi:hypothetical protein
LTVLKEHFSGHGKSVATRVPVAELLKIRIPKDLPRNRSASKTRNFVAPMISQACDTAASTLLCYMNDLTRRGYPLAARVRMETCVLRVYA